MTLRATLLAALLPLSLAAAAPAEETSQRLLNVSGHGEAAAAPDIAFLTVGAAFRDRDARAAVSRVAEAMGAVTKALSDLGIEPRDLQTSTLSLNPVYDHRQDGPPRLSGYEARNALTARLRNVANVGAAIDAASGAGATEFGGINFGFADDTPLRDAALKAAVEDAARKARLVAQTAGAKLGKVHAINIDGYGGGRPVAMSEMAMMRADAAPMPVSTGESRIEANVSVVYELE